MTLKKTAFGRSTLRSYLRTSLWARGRTGEVYLSTSARIGKISGATGALVWSAAASNWSGNACLIVGPTGRLYGYGDTGNGIDEFDTNDGSVLNNYDPADDNEGIAIDFNGKVYQNTTASPKYNVRRLSADLQTVEATLTSSSNYGTPTSNRGYIGIDDDANIYCVENAATDRIISLDSAGTERFLVSPTEQVLTPIYSPRGSYFYMITEEFNSPNYDYLVGQYNYSDGTLNAGYTIISSVTRFFSVGASSHRMTQLGDKLYVPFGGIGATLGYNVIKIDVDTMTKDADFYVGGNAKAVCLLGGGDVVVCGSRNNSWTGSGGSQANTWRLRGSDLSLVWAVDQGLGAGATQIQSCASKFNR